MLLRNWRNRKKIYPETEVDEKARLAEDIREMRELAMLEFDKTTIPPNLIDPLLFEPFVDPVMTAYGRIYSSRSIKRHLLSVSADPLTQEPLTVGQLYQPPKEIMSILDAFNQLRTEKKKRLLEANDTDTVSIVMSSYRFRLIQLDTKMAAACKQLVTDTAIRTIKNNLKLDERNKDHIRFWQSKGKGGDTIPIHVQNMMKAANDSSYETVEDFLAAVNAERRSSRCDSFFKYAFRDEATRNLYRQRDENLKTFVVR